MTIHKSKGLEFPVVIFPFADLDVYRELEPKEWFPLDKEKYNGFSHTLLNYNKDFEHYGEVGLNIYTNHKAEQELDNINLLYVSLTRAAEQLYIITKNDNALKDDAKAKKYSGLFINYLQHINVWDNTQLVYTFGSPKRTLQKTITSNETTIQQEFISTSKEDHNIKVVTKSGFLWNTNQKEAIEKGNLIHNIMTYINTKTDIDFVIADFINTGTINIEQSVSLKNTVLQIVNHPLLETYYTSYYTIYNERDIITKEGMILRPDRVVINSNNEAIIIDYKTGIEDKKHEQQLKSYQDVLEDMQITVKKKILVYTDRDIKVKEV